MFEKIKIFYEKGLWTKEMVYQAYQKGIITLEEYKKIIEEE